MVDGAGFEPAASTMPTLRSSRLIYPPIFDILNLTGTLLSVMGKSFPLFGVLTLMFGCMKETET
jgi:hypothetical protein